MDGRLGTTTRLTTHATTKTLAYQAVGGESPWRCAGGRDNQRHVQGVDADEAAGGCGPRHLLGSALRRVVNGGVALEGFDGCSRGPDVHFNGACRCHRLCTLRTLHATNQNKRHPTPRTRVKRQPLRDVRKTWRRARAQGKKEKERKKERKKEREREREGGGHRWPQIRTSSMLSDSKDACSNSLKGTTQGWWKGENINNKTAEGITGTHTPQCVAAATV